MVFGVTAAAATQLIDRAAALLRDRYRMQVANLSHLATHSNLLFRADLVDGRRLVLRVGQPRANTRSNIDLEVAWLSELVADGMMLVVTPVPTPDERLVVELETDEGPRSCVLFTWVPGEPMGDGAGTSGYRAMGRLSALLHRHGDWRPTDPSLLRTWDRTFYYSPALEPVVVDQPRFDHLFSDIRGVVLRAAAHADAGLAQRWSQMAPIVVHGDLHEWNVHIYMGRAWAIDFEHVMLALPAQDIATSLYGVRIRSDLDSLVNAFRVGYEEYGEWPVRDRAELELYWAARQVMLMNHAAQVLSGTEAREYIDSVLPWLRAYLQRVA